MATFSADPGKYNSDKQLVRKGDLGGVQSVTYSEFNNLLINSNLVPGTKYRITNYRSRNFFYGFQTAQEWFSSGNKPSEFLPGNHPLEGIYQGSIETLIVTAIAPDCIDMYNVFSENYPEDIITYNPYINMGGFYRGVYNGDNVGTVGFDMMWDAQLGEAYIEIPINRYIYFGRKFEIEFSFLDTVLNASISFYIAVNDAVPGINHFFEFNGSGYPEYDQYLSYIRITADGKRIYFPEMTQTVQAYYTADSMYLYGMTEDYFDMTGFIMSRHDTKKNVKAPLDWRGRKYKRWKCTNDFSNNRPIVCIPGVDYLWVAGQDLATPSSLVIGHTTVLSYGSTQLWDVFSTYNPVYNNYNNYFSNIHITGLGHPEAGYNYTYVEFDNTIFYGSVNDFTMDVHRIIYNTFGDINDVMITANSPTDSSVQYSSFKSVTNSVFNFKNSLENVRLFGDINAAYLSNAQMYSVSVFNEMPALTISNSYLGNCSFGGYFDIGAQTLAVNFVDLNRVSIRNSNVEDICVRSTYFNLITIDNCNTFYNSVFYEQHYSNKYENATIYSLKTGSMQNTDVKDVDLNGYILTGDTDNTLVSKYNYKTFITSTIDTTDNVYKPFLYVISNLGWTFSTNLNDSTL